MCGEDLSKDVFQSITTIAQQDRPQSILVPPDQARSNQRINTGNTAANPRKRSTTSQSTETTATNVAGDLYSKGCQSTRTRATNVAGEAAEQNKGRKCNVTWHLFISTMCGEDTNQEVFQCTATIAKQDHQRSNLATTDQARSDQQTKQNTISQSADIQQTIKRHNIKANNSQGMPAFPTELIDIIGNIIRLPSPAPTKPEFFFDLTKEAAAMNFLVLKKYAIDLGQAINTQKLSPLAYGS
jgi:hypothetical protein